MKLLHDWVLVELHELPTTYKNTIVLPEGETGSSFRVGTVLDYGPGEELPSGVRVPIGVEKDDVVIFHRANMEHKQGKALKQYAGDNRALIRGRDMLLALPPGTKHTDLA